MSLLTSATGGGAADLHAPAPLSFHGKEQRLRLRVSESSRTEGRDARGQGMLRVLVVDDHDVVRTGLSSLLSAEPDIEVVAQASGGRMGVRLAAELAPDVVLMDLWMPDLSGPEATKEILERDPSLRVVARTVASEDRDVAAVLEAGAVGFLAKDTPIDRLVEAVHAAATGAAWLSPRAAEVVLGRIRTTTVAEPRDCEGLEQLSERELEVLPPDRRRHGERPDRLGT